MHPILTHSKQVYQQLFRSAQDQQNSCFMLTLCPIEQLTCHPFEVNAVEQKLEVKLSLSAVFPTFCRSLVLFTGILQM